MATRNDSIYMSISSERYTPYSLARKIGAKAILESASFAKGRERYSFLMAEEAFKIVQDEDGIAFLIDGERKPFDTTGITSLDGYEFIPFNASDAREPNDGIGALTPRPKNER